MRNLPGKGKGSLFELHRPQYLNGLKTREWTARRGLDSYVYRVQYTEYACRISGLRDSGLSA